MGNRLAIWKLSKYFDEIETKYLLISIVQKITVAELLYEHEIVSQETIDWFEDEVPEEEKEEFTISEFDLSWTYYGFKQIQT